MLTNRKRAPSAVSRLAIDGGTPVRQKTLPYGRQSVNYQDIEAVVEVLKSDWLTTGPQVPKFEEALCAVTNAENAVVVNSGTAALHCAYAAAGIGPGDEVIVPAISFVATANAAIYLGAKVVFADVSPETLLICPDSVSRAITPQTKAIVSVDYAGQPCDYDNLRSIAEHSQVSLIADACHSLGATYHQRPVGTLADLSALSFHPVKMITTAEGGAVLTNKKAWADIARAFRNHGLNSDHRSREKSGTWSFSMQSPGFNYRLPDILCALGTSQLNQLTDWVRARGELAAHYRARLQSLPFLKPLEAKQDRTHSYHLFVVRLDLSRLTVTRDLFFQALRAEGIGANVHYQPIYQQPYYQTHAPEAVQNCPGAEQVFPEILTLPLFSTMSKADVDDVILALEKLGNAYYR